MSLRSLIYGGISGAGIYWYTKSTLNHRTRIIQEEIHSIQERLPDATHWNPALKTSTKKTGPVKEHQLYTKLRTSWNGMLFNGRDYLASLFEDDSPSTKPKK